MSNKNLKIFVILIFIMILFLCFANVVKAAEGNNKNVYLKILDESDYSAEYKKWLALSDEEKGNYVIPMMYTIDLNVNTLENNEAGVSTLPEKYNLADNLSISIKDQQDTSFCWALAASSVFETTYAKLNNMTTINELSARHMVYATSRYFNNNAENPKGFNRGVDVGGNYFQAVAYWANGSGPILESDMPFVNSMDKIDISEIQNKRVQAQLDDAVFFPSIYKSYSSTGNVTYSNGNGLNYSISDIESFRDMIKNHIINYGAISTMTYMPIIGDDNYFSSNANNCYYCDNTSLLYNHSVTIVGWDDNFSRDNFDGKSKPQNDGAYLVLTSYGNTFGSNGGYYYISYDDYFVENSMLGVQGISDKDYDNIYQYDELGFVYYLAGVNNSDQSILKNIYSANCFEKQTSFEEKLLEVGLYVCNDNTNVTIYLNKDGNDLDINNLTSIGNAENLSTGYHIIKLNNPITIENSFSIIVKYSNDAGAIIPLEMPMYDINNNEFFETASANAGESYFSFDGSNWNDITTIDEGTIDYSNANSCIKAFTVNSTSSNLDTDYITNTKWKLIKGEKVIMLSGIDENTTISELVSANNYLNGYTAKAYKNENQVTTGKVTTGTVIKIYQGSNMVQEYIAVIYGDTTGDGNIQSSDALAIIKNVLGAVLFNDEVYTEAARVTTSKRAFKGNPNAVDALACVKHKLGFSIIVQH